jgi:hypothetical protein
MHVSGNSTDEARKRGQQCAQMKGLGRVDLAHKLTESWRQAATGECYRLYFGKVTEMLTVKKGVTFPLFFDFCINNQENVLVPLLLGLA